MIEIFNLGIYNGILICGCAGILGWVVGHAIKVFKSIAS